MKNNSPVECISYIPPQVDIIHINCQNVLCQSGEAPDMQEGWTYDL